MITKLSALLFLTLPLAAQAEARVPQAPLSLRLEVQTTDATLGLVCSSDQKDGKAFGIVVASATGRTMQFPGLPPLLIPEAVLVCGPLGGGLTYKMPFTALPFDLHIQAAAIVFGQLAVSARRIVPAAQAVADLEPTKGDK